VVETLAGLAFLVELIFMKSSIPVKLKKRSRARPPREGGVDPVVGVRMPPEERRDVEAWAAEQPDNPSLSKAIRRIVQLGLATAAKRAKRKDDLARESAPLQHPRNGKQISLETVIGNKEPPPTPPHGAPPSYSCDRQLSPG
jgi:hypothetical protein